MEELAAIGEALPQSPFHFESLTDYAKFIRYDDDPLIVVLDRKQLLDSIEALDRHIRQRIAELSA
jgi:hypothetical protein